MFETLAPYIIAGLICALGYVLTRWRTVVNYGRMWKASAEISFRRSDELYEQVDAMRREGCAAMGALENIFNGVTAGGMPHSKLVKRVADVATEALILCVPCEHREAMVAAEAEVERLAGELTVARRNSEGWQNLAVEAEGRMEEAERLLGLANDRLIVLQSERDNG